MLAVYPARVDSDRVVAVVKRGKEVEFVAVELSTGRRERLGPAPAAYVDAYWIAADGRAVFRVDDPSGSELGHLVRLGVDGSGPDLTPDWPEYTIRGGEAGADGRQHVAATVDASGFTLALIDASPDGSPASARRLYHSRNEAWRPKLSTDGTLAAIDTTDHSPGIRRFGVTVFETESGARVGELTEPGRDRSWASASLRCPATRASSSALGGPPTVSPVRPSGIRPRVTSRRSRSTRQTTSSSFPSTGLGTPNACSCSSRTGRGSTWPSSASRTGCEPISIFPRAASGIRSRGGRGSATATTS